MPLPEAHYVKKRDLARLLSVSPRTVDHWVAEGVIPYLAPSPRLHLFDVNEVRAALARRFQFRPQEVR